MKISTIWPNKKPDGGRVNRVLVALVVAVLWLCLWQLAYRLINKELLMASPWQVLCRLGQLIGTADFWQITLTSMGRMLAGYALGVAGGTVLAVFSVKLSFLRAFLSPLLSVLRATPVASFIILAIVWLTSAWVPVLIGMIMVLPMVYSNVMTGIEHTDSDLLEMAHCYGFSWVKTLKSIYIPSVKPYFYAACSSALGMCWKACVAAEVLGAPRDSIGAQIYSAKIYLETVDLFAWTAVVIVFSMLLEALLRALMRRGGYDRG